MVIIAFFFRDKNPFAMLLFALHVKFSFRLYHVEARLGFVCRFAYSFFRSSHCDDPFTPLNISSVVRLNLFLK